MCQGHAAAPSAAVSEGFRRMQTEQARLRGSAATARHPSSGLPSRSSRFGVSSPERNMVDLNSASWNQLATWLSAWSAFGDGGRRSHQGRGAADEHFARATARRVRPNRVLTPIAGRPRSLSPATSEISTEKRCESRMPPLGSNHPQSLCGSSLRWAPFAWLATLRSTLDFDASVTHGERDRRGTARGRSARLPW